MLDATNSLALALPPSISTKIGVLASSEGVAVESAPIVDEPLLALTTSTSGMPSPDRIPDNKSLSKQRLNLSPN